MILREEIGIVEVLKIFYDRVFSVGRQLHALADVDIDGSFARATALQKILKDTPLAQRDQTLGLLFGVPISIKDNFVLKGTLSTLGVVRMADHKSEEDKVLALLITKHQGIPFIKTNVPMLLRITETVNHIYGRTANPWGVDRTSGGSSGGEAAMIAALCSPGGYGSDIGGSIRIPAAFTGIYGLKPTPSRVSVTAGKVATLTGKRYANTIIPPAMGPMARSVDDVVRLFRVLADPLMGEVDALVHPKKWNDAEYSNPSRPLRLGWLSSCSQFPSCRAVERAVFETVELLQKLGHEMVKMEVDISDMMWHTVYAFSAGSNSKAFMRVLKGEPPIEEYGIVLMKEKMPEGLVRAIGWLKNKDPERFLKLIECTDNDSLEEFIQSGDYVTKDKLFYEDLMIKHGLDGWVMPVAALPAYKHTHSSHLLLASTYSSFFNILAFPAVSFLVTFVKEDEQNYECEIDDDFTKIAQQTMEGSIGMPIGVQIGLKPYKEELLLHLLKQLEPYLPKVEYPISPVTHCNKSSS